MKPEPIWFTPPPPPTRPPAAPARPDAPRISVTIDGQPVTATVSLPPLTTLASWA